MLKRLAINAHASPRFHSRNPTLHSTILFVFALSELYDFFEINSLLFVKHYSTGIGNKSCDTEIMALFVIDNQTAIDCFICKLTL